ncbi:MAG: hypothetical protein A2V77_22860 [Anaeromyxobacter sp. RBG_16_69_14]|nr:MAG: hypothetical protein A2V77_22860 [Anaeromyxobacter sp. RBG_16_69_14]
MTISFFQEEIEAIYGVRAPRVIDFLVDREGARNAAGEPLAPEALLVRESEGELELGLFLDDDVVSAADSADPHDPRPLLTAPSSLPHLACAAEGVSHFVYLATRAAAGRPVSLLELEVQAEVDKFALLVLHLWRRGLRRLSPALRRRLFERVRYHSHLDGAELERYRVANHLGGGYAGWLESRYVEGADVEGLLRELRQSYRLGGGEKLGYLGARTRH